MSIIIIIIIISIDNYYNSIVLANHTVLSYLVEHYIKAFRSVELDSLQSDSILWHNIWCEAGRP